MSKAESFDPGSDADQEEKKKGRKPYIRVGPASEVYTNRPGHAPVVNEQFPQDILMVDDATPFVDDNGDFIDLF